MAKAETAMRSGSLEKRELVNQFADRAKRAGKAGNGKPTLRIALVRVPHLGDVTGVATKDKVICSGI
jgi:hypothetical protein